MSSGFHEAFPTGSRWGRSAARRSRPPSSPPPRATSSATSTGPRRAGAGTSQTGIKRREDVAELIEFFRCRMGRAYGFRFKDNGAQLLGTGNGSTTTLQLVKRYTSGPATVTRTIRKPVQGSVKVYRDGVLATTGVVTFTSALHYDWTAIPIVELRL